MAANTLRRFLTDEYSMQNSLFLKSGIRGSELSHTKKKLLIVKHMRIMDTLFSQQSSSTVNELIKSIEGEEPSYG